MASLVIPKNDLDLTYIHKLSAMNKISMVIEEAESLTTGPIVRTASVNQKSLIEAFITILSSLNMKVDDSDTEKINEVMSNLSKSGISDGQEKQASHKKSAERKDEIKIVSKSLKDSHYQVDISKDLVTKKGKSVYMVSCYARDAYLGRYLIKRNFFYTAERESSADDAYNEILTKVAAIKDRYYNEITDVSGIFTQIKQMLDGVIAEIKMDEDSLGTNVNRQ